MDEMELKEQQIALLEFIRSYHEEHGFAPSIREIQAGVGFSSTSVVKYHLDALEEKGVISREPGRSRSIRVIDEQWLERNGEEGQIVRVPLLGRIAAGEPLPVPDTSADFNLFGDEVIELTRDLLPETERIYALEVRGNSMIDALIYDGDIVIMRHQEHAENGDMVAVWLREERETTLKRFYHEGNRIRLQPANPTMQPIYVSPEDVEIQGKVIMVVRRCA